MHCNLCGAYGGECGHEPGVTDSVKLSGTCPQCGREFSVTCNGDCLKEGGNKMNTENESKSNKTTTVWKCACSKCGFSWTDSEDNTSCPECGSDEGMCVETTIPSNPVMPID